MIAELSCRWNRFCLKLVTAAVMSCCDSKKSTRGVSVSTEAKTCSKVTSQSGLSTAAAALARGLVPLAAGDNKVGVRLESGRASEQLETSKSSDCGMEIFTLAICSSVLVGGEVDSVTVVLMASWISLEISFTGSFGFVCWPNTFLRTSPIWSSKVPTWTKHI